MNAQDRPSLLPAELQWLPESFSFGPAPVRSFPTRAIRLTRQVAWWGGIAVHVVLAAVWAWEGALVFAAALTVYAGAVMPILVRVRPPSDLIRSGVDAVVILLAATLAGSPPMALPWLLVLALVSLVSADTSAVVGVLATSAVLVPVGRVAVRAFGLAVADPLSAGQMTMYMYLGFFGDIALATAVALVLGGATSSQRAEEEIAELAATREQERLATLFTSAPVPVAEIDLVEVVARCRVIQRRHLKSLEARLTSESELSNNLIGMIRIVRVNDAWARLFERDPDRLTGAVRVDRMPSSIKSAFRKIVMALYRGETSGSFRAAFETLDGRRVDGHFGFDVVGGLRDPDYSRVITTVIDETVRAQMAVVLESRNSELAAALEELEATQSDLVEGRKMEAIGVLASGIAHEINTPIQFVGDNVRFLGDATGDVLLVLQAAAQATAEIEADGLRPETVDVLARALEDADVGFLVEELPAAVDQATEGVERVAAIVQAMKEFAHPGKENLAPVNLNQAIETTVTVSRNEWKYVADLDLSLDPGMGMVPVLAGPLNQVVLNLIVNAAHAIAELEAPEKGTIAVTTRRGDEWAFISVTDTGCGIPADILDRIFEPFYTTKEVGEGSGQGLALAHRVIVDGHRGHIEVHSTVGVGTTFTIRIPLEPLVGIEAA